MVVRMHRIIKNTAFQFGNSKHTVNFHKAELGCFLFDYSYFEIESRYFWYAENLGAFFHKSIRIIWDGN